MTGPPSSDAVARQYDRWIYPTPLDDLEAWLQSNWEWFDPSHAQHLLWPDRDYRPDMDILIAGCGTNQAAVFAFTNPSAHVVAVDVSSSSLDHQRYLQEKYGLWNLTLHQLPLEEVPSLGLEFDLIVSTGVLHHLVDPRMGLQALAECARPDAAIGIMLYAKYGRIGVHLLSSVFKDMGLRQDNISVAMIRDILELVPQNHPIRSYLSIARDLSSDAALVDTFLHSRERNYRVEECIDLVESSGLVFQGWLLNSPYYLHEVATSAADVSSTLTAMPETTQWSIMERLFPANACHFFLACRPERSRETYVIDFSSDASLDYIPELRKGCGLSGSELFRWDWRMGLNPTQILLMQRVNGRRSIREILASVARTGSFGRANLVERETFARELFRSLWRLDFLAMALNVS